MHDTQKHVKEKMKLELILDRYKEINLELEEERNLLRRRLEIQPSWAGLKGKSSLGKSLYLFEVKVFDLRRWLGSTHSSFFIFLTYTMLR